jgi:hypothetical protein
MDRLLDYSFPQQRRTETSGIDSKGVFSSQGGNRAPQQEARHSSMMHIEGVLAARWDMAIPRNSQTKTGVFHLERGERDGSA